MITSPAGEVAKYCYEHVCVSVCLSASISPEPRAIFTIFMQGRVTQSQGEGAIFGDFFPLTINCMGRRPIIAVWIVLRRTDFA